MPNAVLSDVKPRGKVVLASNNAGKLREFSALLAAAGLELVPQGTLGVDEADEPFATFVENALAKARHAARVTGLPALADDSGLCVPALQGAPGVHSARYAQRAGGIKSDAANNRHLLAELERIKVSDAADTVTATDQPSTDTTAAATRHDHGWRRAYYYCVLVLVRHADDPQPLIADGRWDGMLLTTPRGVHGFGYDPLFYLTELGRTAAELDDTEKNRLSHRGQALRALLARLGGNTGSIDE